MCLRSLWPVSDLEILNSVGLERAQDSFSKQVIFLMSQSESYWSGAKTRSVLCNTEEQNVASVWFGSAEGGTVVTLSLMLAVLVREG